MSNTDITCLVTGAAGFIGSHLSEKLVSLGYSVIGIDCFTDYYAAELKYKNLGKLKVEDNFRFISEDLINLNLVELCAKADYVFHEAAQPGVRASWGKSFELYTRNNVNVTQKLLEACKSSTKLKKFIFASSSSVYGNQRTLPIKEDAALRPVSPYGVSKLAAEHLCYLYSVNYGVPTVSLRYFTVYGPRQRPDMAFNKFIRAIVNDEQITIFGKGEQTRDFTYVSDIVDAAISAMNCDSEKFVYNIGGGSRLALFEVLGIISEVTNKLLKLKYTYKQKGDVEHTFADISLAEEYLDYRPKVSIHQGLTEEYEWLKTS